VFGGAPPFDQAGTVIATTSDFEGSRKDTAFTPRASISYKPNRDHNFYASYSQGFKGGGFDPRGQSTQAPTQSPEDIFEFLAFDPETVDSYELGWKGALLDRRLRLATAIFRADYEDVQVPGSAGCIVRGQPSFCGVVTNAGQARFQGVEIESHFAAAEDLGVLGDRLGLAGSLGYLDAEFREFITVVTRNQAGEVIPATEVDLADFREVQNTPKWTLSGTVDYDAPMKGGRLYASTTLSYRSSSQQFEFRSPGLDQEGFALLDANILWRAPGNRYFIGLHGKNLTDTRYISAGYNFLLQNPYTGEYIRPSGAPATNTAELTPTLGQEGVLTAFYGAPRQIFLSFGVNF
jgi:iron complex outermembrane receptor protein